jgi:large subunit ribosomal protein L22
MKAFLKNYRQSPRKVRLVADFIKGKRISDAFVYLDTLPKKASLPIMKLLASAVANAKHSGISEKDLFVANVTVDKGIVMKRSMPRARGSASRINKRTSHVVLTLIEKNVEQKAKPTKKVEKVAEVKKVEKKSKPAKKPEIKA